MVSAPNANHIYCISPFSIACCIPPHILIYPSQPFPKNQNHSTTTQKSTKISPHINIYEKLFVQLISTLNLTTHYTQRSSMLQTIQKSIKNLPQNPFLLSVCALLSISCAQIPPPRPLPTQPLPTTEQIKQHKLYLKAADALYQIYTPQAIQDALKYLHIVLKQNPHNAEAYWKAARCYHWFYDRETQNSRKKYYAHKTLNMASLALKANPQSAGAHYYYAIALGLCFSHHPTMALGNGFEKMLQAAKTAAKLNPKLDFAGPHRLLGYIYLESPEDYGGDPETAKIHFQKAYQLFPNYAENLLGLAKCYLKLAQIAQEEEEPQQAQLLQKLAYDLLHKLLHKSHFLDPPLSLKILQREANNLIEPNPKNPRNQQALNPQTN